MDFIMSPRFKSMAPETRSLAIQILDRYCVRKRWYQQCCPNLGLITLACVRIAYKYEEGFDLRYELLDDEKPKLNDLNRHECAILSALKGELNMPTPIVFIRRINKVHNYDDGSRNVAKYISDLICLDEYFTVVKSSMIAASSYLLARKMLKKIPWVSHFLSIDSKKKKEKRKKGNNH